MFWHEYWEGWQLDAFLARYANQDIRYLRGNKPLSKLDKQLFARALKEHLDNEMKAPTL